jgi:aminoglycoside phosphotransferase (APT) family kinase protein
VGGGVNEPGPLLASGRSADIFDYGPGKVLRRGRLRPIPEHEPVVMRAVRAAGYPAPEVFEVDGYDMVIERVDGGDMLDRLQRRPWHARRLGRMLAELHTRLAAIALDPTVVEGEHVEVRFGAPEAFVHGDLHPGNVLLTIHGPCVIDWEGARIGPTDADAATTWLLLSIADPDNVPLLLRPIVSTVRRSLLKGFLAGVPRPTAATVRAVCDARLGDHNMRPAELERIRQFAADNG